MADENRPDEQKPEPLLLVKGERAGLGALRRELIPAYHRWRSDAEVMRGQGRTEVSTIEAVQAWYDQATSPGSSEVHFTVYDLTDLTPVGTALLVRIDHHQGTAEFGILIGERRGQGLGTEATRLTLDWGFTVLGLHNILLVTFSWNIAALRAYEKAGFQEIGRRRGAVITLGRRFDQVLMDAIADEFTGSVLSGQAPPEDPRLF
jgi:RimJ/RimL family protein N-acetyltransferase